ncbi:hypothetical protein [Peptoniphilus catoniae]|uniref:hypothetical protein n=1 Tax=Peptoniphilus catoniae TaxID=1660341 RepID=UPI0010FD99F8|nr:hypothetical protein [Peptoniphilus catoniae]
MADEKTYKKLVTLYDDFHLDSIKAMLKDEEIPFSEKKDEVNTDLAQIIGNQISGTSLYVPEKFLQTTRKLINTVLGIDFSGYEEEEKEKNN